MTRVAAVKVAVGSDDRNTYAEMLKMTQRRRRVDKAKVHRALALLARDLDIFVGSFNARLKTVAQLTFHDAPDDLRVASIGRGEIRKKRSRRAGARVQRGRRNAAKGERGMEASPRPLLRPTEGGGHGESQEEGQQEPPRKVSAVAPSSLLLQLEGRAKSWGRSSQRPPLVVNEGAVGASSRAVALMRDDRAVGAVPVQADTKGLEALVVSLRTKLGKARRGLREDEDHADRLQEENEELRCLMGGRYV